MENLQTAITFCIPSAKRNISTKYRNIENSKSSETFRHNTAAFRKTLQDRNTLTKYRNIENDKSSETFRHFTEAFRKTRVQNILTECCSIQTEYSSETFRQKNRNKFPQTNMDKFGAGRIENYFSWLHTDIYTDAKSENCNLDSVYHNC